MLALAGACTMVIAASLVLGIAVLNALDCGAFTRRGDRFVAAVWAGLVVLSVSLLTLSLAVPLSPWAGTAVLGAATGFPLLVSSTRRDLRDLCAPLDASLILGIGMVVLVTAAAAASPVTHYDTGLYHFGAIRWLSRNGVTTGLALLHDQFAKTSSWFALAAPFNAGPLEARFSTVAGAVALLIAILHLSLCSARVLARAATAADVFVVVAFLLVLPRFLRSPLSGSPDIPVIMLTVTVAWAILVARAVGDAGRHVRRRNRYAIALLLSAGATTMKLNAAPLLAVSAVLYVSDARQTLAGLAVCSVLLLPGLVFGTISSGCPLYPSPVPCLDLPWSLGSAYAARLRTALQLSTRWQTGPPPPDATAWNWIWPWMVVNIEGSCLLVYSLIGGVAMLVIRRGSGGAGIPWIVGLAGLGILFTGYSAPEIRFGLGYLALTPAGVAAVLGARRAVRPAAMLTFGIAGLYLLAGHLRLLYVLLLPAFIGLGWAGAAATDPGDAEADRRLPRSRALVGSLAAASVALFVGAQVHVNQWIRHELLGTAIPMNAARFPLVLPPRLPIPGDGDLLRRHVHDVDYVTPKVGEQCWAAELPCTPRLAAASIRLRSPHVGIDGGFVRALDPDSMGIATSTKR